jgi:hypothetical protein
MIIDDYPFAAEDIVTPPVTLQMLFEILELMRLTTIH